MLKVKVSGITCGGCAAAIERALGLVVPGAKVDISVAQGLVAIDVLAMERAKVMAAIEEAGFIVTGEVA